ncbi:olfactory receptor 6M1-like [Apteryx mantelli]|uniref:Olfactory receptor n=1 Tax=Apteryx mantelli TaxID=2696672 RepID=A0ABM4FNK2_9AVES
MTDTYFGNRTCVTEFILIGFLNPFGVQVTLFMFFIVFLVTTFGNSVIIMLTCSDYHLQSPVYFFLCNLSIIEILLTVTVVPKMMEKFLSERKTISFYSCLAQSYFYFLLGTTEYVLLAVMSYNRYVAICSPLHYSNIMRKKVCMWLAVASWLCGFFSILVPTLMKLQLPFCGPNTINHFFCDSAPLMHLACADIPLVEFIDFIISLSILLGSLLLTVFSHFYIICAVICTPSVTGKQKAFSTSASHFTVLTISYGTSVFIYVHPSQTSSMNLNKVASLLTTAFTPMPNPFIFSLRNQKVKEALTDLVSKCVGVHGLGLNSQSI